MTDNPAGTGLFQKLKAVFVRPKTYDEVALTGEVHLLGDEIRVPFNGVPLRIILGKNRQGKTLWVCPEFMLDPKLAEQSTDFIIFDPERYFSEPSGFFRLEAGDSIMLGRGDEQQQAFFHFPRSVSSRHLTIAHTGDAFILKDLTLDSGSYIAPLGANLEEERLVSQKMSRLARIREIYGGPIRLLPPEEALHTLLKVDALLAREAGRPLDDRNLPGGLVLPPEGLTPLVVGDLHGQVDNLLKILVENHCLDGLEAGTLYMVLLGDAVHSEVDGQMEEMESSLLMMDLIYKLKLRFPSQIFYLRGNHDSFSEDVGKAGVPQGLLWRDKILATRGERYKEAVDQLYQLLPVCARSDAFIACHAGPPKAQVTQDLLVNTHRYPGLVRELIWNRLRRPNYPAGYTKMDVVRFRKGMNVAPDTPFIVAHNPLSRDVSVWMDVGEIRNHHIVFSGRTDQISVFVQIKGILSPLVYTTEPLLDLINRL